MDLAKITKVGGKIIIRTPYNADLVDEIRGIPGRVWDARVGVWSVPAASEQQIREIVRLYFQIEGEPSYIKYKVVRARVTGSSTGESGVTIDGRDLWNPASGYLDMRSNNEFEILDYTGGFVGEVTRTRKSKVFAVDYTVKVRCREDAEWRATGYGGHYGTYEILSGDNPVDQFLDSLSLKELE